MQNASLTVFLLLFVLLFSACPPPEVMSINEPEPAEEKDVAAITAVTPSGSERSYTFAVEITSPDTGCDQYADWWEVVSLDGSLLHRRILGHSHVDEQPFTRSGSPVNLSADEEVWVRVHMNNLGYSRKAFKGSVAGGFAAANTADDFAGSLETEAPLPDGCAF